MIKTIPIQKTTVDMATGCVTQTETVSAQLLTSVRPGCCEACGTEHAAGEPHNQQSLTYQYNFYADHGRWPTWSDALAHCSDAVRQHWEKELVARGVNIEGDKS
jgi:hypothetical protein